MSLGIIQKERTAYGRARANEWGAGGGSEWRVVGEKSTAISVKLHNKVLSSLTVVYETTAGWQRALPRLCFRNFNM